MTRISVVDTGLRTGRENIAHDQAMIDAHVDGLIGDTFKFIHFKPCALIGRHQDLSQELKLDECARLGVQTVRRVTGGGAIYFDEGQLGWALVCDRKTVGGSLTEITEKICTAAAIGLSKLGIDAQFRPRNDIEVGGQKISGTGGFFDGNTLMFQGTVLIDLNSDVMMSVLNVPAHKLAKHDLENAAQRVTSLKNLLGSAPSKGDVKTALIAGFKEHLGLEMIKGGVSETVEKLAVQYHAEEIGTDEFVEDINNPSRRSDTLVGRNKSGNLKAHVRLEGPRSNRLREVVFTGDIFITPPRVLMDLEAHLRGVNIDKLEAQTHAFFSNTDVGLLSVQPAEFGSALMDAIK